MNIEDLKFDEKGLIPAIVQDAASGKVLMLAYMNSESIKMTID
ncbi:MAG: bifunctional phosphoribosyl-AMP cyclohydrolase/phosphoribosyl-ATP pyrophosphatase, partial [Nitrospinota bacterium]